MEPVPCTKHRLNGDCTWSRSAPTTSVPLAGSARWVFRTTCSTPGWPSSPGVIEAGMDLEPGLLVAELRIARVLDYYTDTVYETQMLGHESIGVICSGGRYDDLAGTGQAARPGVGMPVGVTRILGRLIGQGLLSSSRDVPTCVLIAIPDEARRRTATGWPPSSVVGASPRSRSRADRYGKQIRHADQRGIPFVWFPGDNDTAESVRDIRIGQQVDPGVDSWEPSQQMPHPT